VAEVAAVEHLQKASPLMLREPAGDRRKLKGEVGEEGEVYHSSI
jgi:hypothetical protein